MKNRIKNYVYLSSVALILQTPAPLQAMPVHGCVDANITMNIITTKLSFASVVPCGSVPGTVSVNPATGAVTSNPACINASGSPFRARVKVTGNQGSGPADRVLVTLSSGATINNGGNNMNVTGLALNPGGGTTATFNAKNAATYDIGGTLNVGTSQPGGTYNGTFTITAVCL